MFSYYFNTVYKAYVNFYLKKISVNDSKTSKGLLSFRAQVMVGVWDNNTDIDTTLPDINLEQDSSIISNSNSTPSADENM